MSIGTTIKKLRRDSNITQERLAELLGVSTNAVSQWECDKTAPDISHIPALASIFEVSADVLLEIDIAKSKKQTEIKKFTAFIVQGLEKGSRDLAIALRNQTDELWELKKQNVLKQGELASSKLMMPLMIMFAGILVMVMGPIMTNLGI